MPDPTQVYLDHAATTALRPEARAAMERAWDVVGNPASVHAAGRAAHCILDDAREEVAAALGAHPTEVVFTSGGTEACNLAVAGLTHAVQASTVITSTVEHPAVEQPAATLQDAGVARHHQVPVARDGEVDCDDLREATSATALVSIQAANSELGCRQDLGSVVEAARGATVHSDAVALGGDLDFSASGLAAASISAHKLGGPVGIGALLVRRGLRPHPQLVGGGQESGLRSGTVPVALAAGFAAALSATGRARPAESVRLTELRRRVREAVTGVTGARVCDAREALPGVVMATFAGCEGEVLLYLLDKQGIAVSTGSACHAGVVGPNPVLLAGGYSRQEASGALRISLGWTTTEADIARLAEVLPQAVATARAAALAVTGERAVEVGA